MSCPLYQVLKPVFQVLSLCLLEELWSCVNRSKWQGSCWRSESTSDQRNLYMQPVSVLCISQSEMTDIDVSGVVLSEPSCISTASVCTTKTMENPLTCTYSSYNTSRGLEATTVYVLKDAKNASKKRCTQFYTIWEFWKYSMSANCTHDVLMDKFSIINFCELRYLFPRRLLSKQRKGEKRGRVKETELMGLGSSRQLPWSARAVF